mmetsp:Transcript_373/g.221  ORF Transcript_373/g.221 Transcript_373/m.221 type:complete len:201 (+) Transcript_373:2-604(+)
MIIMHLISTDPSLRMYIEHHTEKLALSLITHLLSGMLLVLMRNFRFTIPRFLGSLIFSFFLISSFYLSMAMVVHRGYIPIFIHQFFVLNDALFTYIYSIFTHYVFPSGVFGFCIFPKVFLLFCLCVYFDDRIQLIFGFFALTTVTSAILGIVIEEIIQDCLQEEIHEFGTLDYFSFFYLDLYYIGYKLKLNLKESLNDLI